MSKWVLTMKGMHVNRTKPICQNECWLWKECMLTELNQYVKMSVDYERNACKKELNQYVQMSVDYERNACKKRFEPICQNECWL